MLTDTLTEVAISPYRKCDGESVIRLILSIQREEMGMTTTLDDQPDLLAISDFYRGSASGFWCAQQGDEVIGTIALKAFGDNKVALRKMFVAEGFRGKAHGVAAALLDTALSWAWQAGADSVWLGTIHSFHAACRFYYKHGFTQVTAEALPEDFLYMAPDDTFYGQHRP